MKSVKEVKQEAVSEEERKMKRNKTFMEIFAVSFNKQFQEKKGG